MVNENKPCHKRSLSLVNYERLTAAIHSWARAFIEPECGVPCFIDPSVIELMEPCLKFGKVPYVEIPLTYSVEGLIEFYHPVVKSLLGGEFSVREFEMVKTDYLRAIRRIAYEEGRCCGSFLHVV